MTTNPHLDFLQQKIAEISTAIFFNLSDAVLKLPTSLISTLKVDDFGYIWFFVKKPKQDIHHMEQEFPVRLDYFRKGKNCFLQVSGKAWVIADPEIISTYMMLSGESDLQNLEDHVLVKVKILKADFQEKELQHRNSWWNHAINSISSWFGVPQNGFGNNTYFPAS